MLPNDTIIGRAVALRFHARTAVARSAASKVRPRQVETVASMKPCEPATKLTLVLHLPNRNPYDYANHCTTYGSKQKAIEQVEISYQCVLGLKIIETANTA